MFQIQDYYISYKKNTQDLLLFIYASNTFFNNNILDQKSFQGHIIKFFGKNWYGKLIGKTKLLLYLLKLSF